MPSNQGENTRVKYGENEYYLYGLYTESELLEIIKKGKAREKAFSDSMRRLTPAQEFECHKAWFGVGKGGK